MDLLIASFSIGFGAIASFAFRQLRKYKIAKSDPEKKRSRNYHPETIQSTSDVEMMKNELDSLELEKSLITSSVRKIHESLREGKLSQLEFDRIMTKYAEDLRKCEIEIDNTRSIVDLYELSAIKNNLVSIIEDKIKVIDARLTKLSNSNIKMPSRQSMQYRQYAMDHHVENAPSCDGVLDNSLRAEAEEIQNLETEVTQALEKLDSVESRKFESISISKSKTNSEENGDEKILKSNSDQPSNINVTTKRDPLRNLIKYE